MSLESSFSRSRLAGMTKALCLRLLLLAAFSYVRIDLVARLGVILEEEKRKGGRIMEAVFVDPATKALFQKAAASLNGISISLIEFINAQGPDGRTLKITPRDVLPNDFYNKYTNIRAYVFVGTAFQLA